MSESFISALQQYMAQTDLSISTSSISISEFLREAAQQIFPSVSAIGPEDPSQSPTP